MWRRAAWTVILVALLGLGLIEGWLAWTDFAPEGYYIPRFYSGVPGDLEPSLSMVEALFPHHKYHISTTPQGTRGLRPFSPDKPKGTLRVLCLGDSFTFSAGVDDKEAYPELLERELSLRYPGAKIEVINAGISMFGLLDELDYYLEKGRALRPDVVVLQFYANDLQDQLRDVVFREVYRTYAPYCRQTLANHLLGWSRLYQWAVAWDRMRRNVNHVNIPLNQGVPRCTGPIHDLDQFRFCAIPQEKPFQIDRDRLLHMADTGELARVWESYFVTLQAFRNMVEADGTRFLFLSIPDRWQVTGYRNGVNAVLARHTADLSIPAIELVDTFRKAKFRQGLEPYLGSGDDHCSPYGNLLVARAVAEALAVTRTPSGEFMMTLRPLAPLFSWNNPLRVDAVVAEPAGLAFSGASALRAVVERSQNLILERETSVAIDTLKAAPEAEHGELLLRVNSAQPLERIDVRLANSLPCDPQGRSLVRLEVSQDGKGWWTAYERASDRSGAPGGFEQYAIVECPFPDARPTNLLMRLTLAGEAKLYTARAGSSDEDRAIWINGFPARPEPGWQP